MKLNIRLKEVLHDNGLDYHGVRQQLAKDTGINRHTISKIYNNQATSISLDTLGKICTWLKQKGASIDNVLGDFFGSQPSKFWQVLEARDTVTIYLGESQQTRSPAAAWRWISRRDSDVASKVVTQLSSHRDKASTPPQLKYEYVPFKYDPNNHMPADPLKGDVKRARQIFADMKNNSLGNGSIIIGSQRVNYLLEFYVANLFGCEAFPKTIGPPKVPFFFVYRESDRNIPSCFGGFTNPYCNRNASTPGIHYVNNRGSWICCPWKEIQQDTGIIIIVHDPRIKSLEVAIFGFSGRATSSICDQLFLKEDLFWPPTVTVNNKEVGIYVFKIQCILTKPSERFDDNIQVDNCDVIPLSSKIIKQYLA